MARLDDIERRLLNWARWRAGLRGGRLGFAAPSMGERVDGAGWDAQATIPTSDVEASLTDEAIKSLTLDQQRTVAVVYLDSGGMQRHAARLALTVAGVNARLDVIHRRLSAWFADRAARGRDERARVEALQRRAAD